jgi:hypothetical protein
MHKSMLDAKSAVCATSTNAKPPDRACVCTGHATEAGAWRLACGIVRRHLQNGVPPRTFGDGLLGGSNVAFLSEQIALEIASREVMALDRPAMTCRVIRKDSPES